MTLLHPWAAAAAAGIGLLFLSLLYVLKLRRRVMRVGSTLLWEQALAEVEVNTPWRRFRPDWMFLLQALAIMCLALAIGRPAMGLSASQRRVVIVIDRSASMAAIDRDAEGTRLERAKKLAAETIENLRRAGVAETAVVSFAKTSRVESGFTRTSASSLDGVSRVTQTDEPGDLASLREALDALTVASGERSSETAGPGVQAMVFSDGGFDPAPVDGPPGVVVKLVRIGPEPGVESPAANVGIVSIAAQRDEADPATVRLVARLVSTFTEQRTISLRVSLGSASLGSSTVSIPASGEQTVVLPVSTREGGVLTLRVMNDDALSTDNTASLVIDGAREASVLVVAPPGPGQYAVDPLVLSFAQSAGPAARVIGAEQLNSLADWAGVDLVIFDRVEPPPNALPPVASVSLGAGLRSLGVMLTPPTAGDGRERVVSWKRDHPLMRDVALDALVLERPATLQLPPRAVTLAEGVRGPLIALVEGEDGVGHVVSALSAQQGGWGADLSFVVFMGNAMDYLTLRGRAKAGLQFAVGDTLTAVVAPGPGTLNIVRPDGTSQSVAVAGDPASGRRTVAAGVADRAGVYSVSGGAEGVQRFAVNLSSTQESRLATSNTLPIRSRGSAVTADKESAKPPREVWDWFVLAAVGVLAVEWLVYAALVRK